jgi:hypothetical protein
MCQRIYLTIGYEKIAVELISSKANMDLQDKYVTTLPELYPKPSQLNLNLTHNLTRT